MKPNLISGTYTSAGTVGVIYADTTDDLAMDEYIGVDKRQLACGSVAYLKNQDTLVMDSTKHWVTDDETVISNKNKDWFIPKQSFTTEVELVPIIEEQTFTGTKSGDGYQATLTSISAEPPAQLQVDFDGATYTRDKQSVGDLVVYGATLNPDTSINWDECPFVLIYAGDQTIAMVTDGDEHTISAVGLYDTYSVYPIEAKHQPYGDFVTVVVDGKEETVEWDGGCSGENWEIYADGVEELTWYFSINTAPSYHSVGAYEVIDESTVYKALDNVTFTATEDSGHYFYPLGAQGNPSPIGMFKYVEVTYDGVTKSAERQSTDGYHYGDMPDYTDYMVYEDGIEVTDDEPHTISVTAYRVNKTNVVKNATIQLSSDVGTIPNVNMEGIVVVKADIEYYGKIINCIGTSVLNGSVIECFLWVKGPKGWDNSVIYLENSGSDISISCDGFGDDEIIIRSMDFLFNNG